MRKLNTAEKLLEEYPFNEAKKQKFDLIKTKLNVRLYDNKTCYEILKELFGYLRKLGKKVK